MQLPLQISFRGFPSSPSVEQAIQEKAQKLDQLHPNITSCRVMVEATHRHHHKGKLYHVRIELGVPQNELVISDEKHDKHSHEDVYVAIRDAFDAAKRQLKSHIQRLRHETKAREVPPHGYVAQLFADSGHGFISTPDGREIYFHRNSVLGGGFDTLEVGNAVRFTEEQGEQGPQASTVYPVGKHHIVG